MKVKVRAASTENKESKFQIEVIDTGRGLTPAQKERLFQPFMQADNTTTREYGGTGLGLALSRRLAQALGGTVEIRDFALGKGCTFVITFTAKSAKVRMTRPSQLIRMDGSLLSTAFVCFWPRTQSTINFL